MSEDNEVHRALGAHDARLTSLETGQRDIWRKLDGMDAKMDRVVEWIAKRSGGLHALRLLAAFVAGVLAIAGSVAAVIALFKH